MQPRTQRQRDIYEYITRFIERHGYEPSYAQIARHFGVSSKATIDKQICDGDIALIETGTEARDGEIVVAVIEGARATLKRLYRFGTEVELRPANSQHEPIRLHASKVAVQGIFRGLLRPAV